jgi:hypothetical protein
VTKAFEQHTTISFLRKKKFENLGDGRLPECFAAPRPLPTTQGKAVGSEAPFGSEWGRRFG